MEYNTTRKKLIMPEYGRNVQKMVDNCMAIEDREERTQFAKIIVDFMVESTGQKDNDDLRHKLWDHLHIISGFKLEVDSPFAKPSSESVKFRPDRMGYSDKRIRYRFYGKNLTNVIKKLSAIPRDAHSNAVYSLLIGNHMKKLYLTWNRDSVDDVIIENHIKELSGGALNVDNSQLDTTRKIIESTASTIKRHRVDKIQDIKRNADKARSNKPKMKFNKPKFK